LIDLLLALVWLAAHPDLRPCLYGRIERDLSLPDRIGRESYDGLLLAAWLLDQWPGRLHEAMEELRVPALPWTVGRQALFTPDAERALRSVLDSEYVDAETLPLAAIE
jgi:hypothetical protein